ncbi:MAG: EscU/YscU/HrcU family type III secretion system export apparatus switch protein, partial [Pseudothermotoga sp.]
MDCTREIAVALGYDPERFDAPFVIAKGKGELARKILEEARKHNV